METALERIARRDKWGALDTVVLVVACLPLIGLLVVSWVLVKLGERWP